MKTINEGIEALNAEAAKLQGRISSLREPQIRHQTLGMIDGLKRAVQILGKLAGAPDPPPDYPEDIDSSSGGEEG